MNSLMLKGKYGAMIICWLLGNGCLFSWNSMLTIEDYYGYLFPVTTASYLSSMFIWLLNIFLWLFSYRWHFSDGLQFYEGKPLILSIIWYSSWLHSWHIIVYDLSFYDTHPQNLLKQVLIPQFHTIVALIFLRIWCSLDQLFFCYIFVFVTRALEISTINVL